MGEFEKHLDNLLKSAKASLSMKDVGRLGTFKGQDSTLKILYHGHGEYQALAKRFELMPDEKEGMRRSSYRGIISFAWQGNHILLYSNKFPREDHSEHRAGPEQVT